MLTIAEVKNNLIGLLHGGTLNKVRNIEYLFERTANTMLTKIDVLDTIRTRPLSSTIHDDVYNYSLPLDYKKIIDLFPQDTRQLSDSAPRITARLFDLQKMIKDKKLSIEGSEGSKIIRINWRSRQGKVLSALNGIDDNGEWTEVGSAFDLKQDTITKRSGSGSLRVNLNVTGDGIENTTLAEVDLTDEDEVADGFTSFYIKNAADLANLNSISAIWGNDLTSNYWTGVAQLLQMDGSAFQTGWNEVKFPWSTATETGTVDPETMDSLKIVFGIDAAISEVRIDNFIFNIGRAFDIKYYSKYIFKNSSGVLLSRPTSDDDVVQLDNDAMQIFLLECTIACAQQMEGEDSGFDIGWAKKELNGDPNSTDRVERIGLYGKYRSENPSMSKKAMSQYGSSPARGRWPRSRYNRR